MTARLDLAQRCTALIFATGGLNPTERARLSLSIIRDLAMIDYPWDDGTDVNYPAALGYIAGLATKTLEEGRQ